MKGPKVKKKPIISSRIKKWLQNESQITVELIQNGLKVTETNAETIFKKLKLESYVRKPFEEKDWWYVNHSKLKGEKRARLPVDLPNDVKIILENIETSYHNWNEFYGFSVDPNPYRNIPNFKNVLEYLDPVHSYIYSCLSGYATAIISDRFKGSSLNLIAGSIISNISLEKLISGNMSETDWPRLVSAFGELNDWLCILTNVKNKPLKHVQKKFRDYCNSPGIDVIILDIDSKEVVLTEAELSLAKKMKKKIIIKKGMDLLK